MARGGWVAATLHLSPRKFQNFSYGLEYSKKNRASTAHACVCIGHPPILKTEKAAKTLLGQMSNLSNIDND